MGDIVDLSGKRLFKEAPVGFYVVGECPECESPMYYHGSGIIHNQGDALTIPHDEVISQSYYPTCLCGVVPKEVAVPPVYSFAHERDSIDSLFQNLMMMIQHMRNLEGRVSFFTSQIQEVPNEDSDSGEPQLRLVAGDGIDTGSTE